ncbi:MAG: beta-eliminating lyase-related protein [Eggerthellales bacterium]|nr:beta-eliminating lyase-related protein [Eggerthellales bacterium]
MFSFRNDYSEGAHPLVLETLAATNLEQHVGYTEDELCAAARASIVREVFSADTTGVLARAGIAPQDIQVEFVAGGTMANLLVITAGLRPYECVVAAPDGHINVHETGSVEARGHKVVTTSDSAGLLTAQGIDDVMLEHCYGTNYHMVAPRMVYLSFATELGMVHTAKQLYDIRAYADSHDLMVFIDGARIACGLAASGCDVTLADICACADAFTLGGTKNGMLFGEAVVIRNPAIGKGFRNLMKQQGGIMAKGRLFGAQFGALLDTTGKQAGIPEAQGDEAAYFSLGRHSVKCALEVRRILEELGFDSWTCDSPTNQQFLTLDNERAQRFIQLFGCEDCGKPDREHTIVRFVCSWATPPEALEYLRQAVIDAGLA